MFVVGAEDGNMDAILPFAGMRALSLSTDPSMASRPFDTGRDGFVGTGGGVVLVLETEEEVIVSAAPSTPAVESQEKTAESPLASALKATEPEIPSVVPSINNVDDSVHTTRLSFNDYDSMLSVDKQEESKFAPKDLESLEKAAADRARKQQQEEEESRLKLSDSILSLDDLGIVSLDTVDPIQAVAPPIDDLMGLLDIQTI
jgi:hypothetical protein